jgi:predicted lipoprotein with Yx(FWY)xxD motif
MQKSLVYAAVVAAILAASTAAFAESTPPAMIGDTAKGKTLVDAHGMTLYVFDKDMGGKSACNGPCATNWPPLMATSGAGPSGDYSITTRDDATSQWAYKGRPLYTWKNDKKPGDITGDGFLNNAWHVATP